MELRLSFISNIILIPYDRYDWLMMKDLERCPYPPFRSHPLFKEWNDNDDRRMELIALDRYASYLLGELKDEDTPRGFSPYWKYENWEINHE